MTEIRCHVCGWLLDELPWGADGRTPTFEICSCCGCEFGYEDCRAIGVSNHRKKWLDSGGQWFSPARKPDDWSMEAQLKRIPDMPVGVDRNR